MTRRAPGGRRFSGGIAAAVDGARGGDEGQEQRPVLRGSNDKHFPANVQPNGDLDEHLDIIDCNREI